MFDSHLLVWKESNDLWLFDEWFKPFHNEDMWLREYDENKITIHVSLNIVVSVIAYDAICDIRNLVVRHKQSFFIRRLRNPQGVEYWFVIVGYSLASSQIQMKHNKKNVHSKYFALMKRE